MQTFLRIFFSGLSLGAIYCVFALGLSLVYGTSRVLNFAFGSTYMTMAYVAWFLSNGWLGLDLFWIFVLLMPVAFVFGLLTERLIIRPVRARSNWNIATMMTTLGFAFVLDNFNLVVFGPTAKSMPPLMEGATTFLGVTVAKQTVATLGLSLAAVAALQLFLTYAPLGQAMRAVSQDSTGAEIVGIRVDRVFAISFGLSTMLAAFAALLLAPVYLVSPLGGWAPFLRAFVIVVFGGLGSTQGVLWASFILAFIEATVIALFGATWILPIWFVVLLAVLMVRPRGLLGKWGN
jgi:branched-chain amino acid transport system permease protein